MANVAASTKLASGLGPLMQGGLKAVCVSFATTATGDVLIFDASNVGKENALSKIYYAHVITATGPTSSLVVASNQVTVGSNNGADATNVIAFCIGIGG